MNATLLLRGGVDAAGARLDVRVDAATGAIVHAEADVTPSPADTVVACFDMVLLPAPAEPHAHLDKALSAAAAPNPAGDLVGAIAAWHAYRPTLDEAEILGRARAAAHELVVHGTTAIRTHVDVGPGIGLRGLHALVALREELAEQQLAQLQIVALISPPLTGPEGAENRELLAAALDAGADVAGGCPHLDPDPVGATAAALDAAELAGTPIDLHSDETLDPRALAVRDLARMVVERGFVAGAVASHCVSLGVQTPEVQALVARELADAGVAVVALPQTNLYLQAREVAAAPPRGLTAVRALLDAGVTVAAGADNVRDPFNCVGRSDPLETAALMVMAAHLTPEEAWARVSTDARAAMGLPAVALVPGAPAEILAVHGASLADAIARGSEHRFVIHAGRCVARTEVRTVLEPSSTVPALTS
ncbi:Pterin deaminase [Baekduia alba]|uniref:amidohydrolase family protein n=1 Tax=Baekduia alba TaxID=2997333 RepID=UPI0023420E64|nr:amidohydrolase family protein [Baekduia alba]WCB94609.1 Pterin deaminase [Baekduia alba]